MVSVITHPQDSSRDEAKTASQAGCDGNESHMHLVQPSDSRHDEQKHHQARSEGRLCAPEDASSELNLQKGLCSARM